MEPTGKLTSITKSLKEMGGMASMEGFGRSVQSLERSSSKGKTNLAEYSCILDLGLICKGSSKLKYRNVASSRLKRLVYILFDFGTFWQKVTEHKLQISPS